MYISIVINDMRIFGAFSNLGRKGHYVLETCLAGFTSRKC